MCTRFNARTSRHRAYFNRVPFPPPLQLIEVEAPYIYALSRVLQSPFIILLGYIVMYLLHIIMVQAFLVISSKVAQPHTQIRTRTPRHTHPNRGALADLPTS